MSFHYTRQSLAKQPAVVSEVLRQSARGEDCTLRLPDCQGRRGVVLAHVRTPGTGMGRKPDDIAAVYACHACHDHIDGRRPRLGDSELDTDVLHALIRTHRRMWERGLLQVPGGAPRDPAPPLPED